MTPRILKVSVALICLSIIACLSVETLQVLSQESEPPSAPPAQAVGSELEFSTADGVLSVKAFQPGVHFRLNGQQLIISSAEQTSTITLGPLEGKVHVMLDRYAILAEELRLSDNRGRELLEAKFASASPPALTTPPVPAPPSSSSGAAPGEDLFGENPPAARKKPAASSPPVKSGTP